MYNVAVPSRNKIEDTFFKTLAHHNSLAMVWKFGIGLTTCISCFAFCIVLHFAQSDGHNVLAFLALSVINTFVVCFVFRSGVWRVLKWCTC